MLGPRCQKPLEKISILSLGPRKISIEILRNSEVTNQQSTTTYETLVWQPCTLVLQQRDLNWLEVINLPWPGSTPTVEGQNHQSSGLNSKGHFEPSSWPVPSQAGDVEFGILLSFHFWWRSWNGTHRQIAWMSTSRWINEASSSSTPTPKAGILSRPHYHHQWWTVFCRRIEGLTVSSFTGDSASSSLWTTPSVTGCVPA